LLRVIEAFGESNNEFAFPRLTSTGWEAEQIARLAPANQVFKALSFDANRQMATSGKLGDYRIVHFASHSLINATHPDLSGIVLSLVDRRGQEQDGFLRLHEIYNLKLSADLVVLGGCRTGLGKEIKGEGLMSLTRGFMYAGAPRVIVSAWEVQDRPSATLMVKFYRGLLGPKRLSAAAALRAAQIEMLRDKQFAAPYFWAGFTLQGEWK
jgi:CHAT domain-containing protein